MENKSVLHVAPESSIQAKFNAISQKGLLEYRAGDLFTDGYKYQCEKLDISSTNYPECTFDLVICNHVLEHIPNVNKALTEIHRILKIGGKAIVQVPISYKLEKTFEDFSVTTPHARENSFGQFDHVRINGNDYTTILSNAGFSVIIEKPSSLISPIEFKMLGLNPKENIFIAQKIRI